jgi:hypothetical protein
MSNPTELPDLLPCPFCGGTNIDPAEWSASDGKSGPGCGDCGALAESADDWNRRAQPEGEAPQADWISAVVRDVAELPDRDSPPGREDMMLVTVNELHDIIERHAPVTSLSPLCGAQHAESGKEVPAWRDAHKKVYPNFQQDDLAAHVKLAWAEQEILQLRAALAAQQAAAPADCSGTPSSCPDNEGYGCHCSAPGTPEAPAGYVIVPIEPTERMIYEGGIGRRDQMVDAADVWRQMLRAAQLDGGQEGSGSNG